MNSAPLAQTEIHAGLSVLSLEEGGAVRGTNVAREQARAEDVAPGVVGFLWGVFFSVPLWLLIGAGIWFSSSVL